MQIDAILLIPNACRENRDNLCNLSFPTTMATIKLTKQLGKGGGVRLRCQMRRKNLSVRDVIRMFDF